MKLRTLRILLWIGLLLGLTELGLEYRGWQRGWETPIFGKLEAWAPAGESGYGPTAAFPFRSARVSPDRTPGVARLWMASSSYGEDVQLAPEVIFPNVLAERLTASGQPAEMLNCSRAGMDTLGNVADLADLGPLWKPDVVVLYQVSNDIDSLSRVILGGLELAAGVGKSPRADQVLPTAGLAARLTEWTEHTALYAHVKSRITAPLTGARVLADSLGAAGDAAFRSRIEVFLRECDTLGATPVLATFATGHLARERETLPAEWASNLFRYNIYLSVDGWFDAIARYNRIVREIAAEREIPLADVAGAVAGRAELFRDFTHFEPEGHELAAEALEGAVLQALAARSGLGDTEERGGDSE